MNVDQVCLISGMKSDRLQKLLAISKPEPSSVIPTPTQIQTSSSLKEKANEILMPVKEKIGEFLQPERECMLPPRYKQVCKIVTALDSAINYLKSRKMPLKFDDLRAAVEVTSQYSLL